MNAARSLEGILKNQDAMKMSRKTRRENFRNAVKLLSLGSIRTPRHQAMMRFEKRRQREDENIDKFLDDLQLLSRSSQPDESNRRMNLAISSKFNDGVKNDEFRTMLATHYTPFLTNAPIPEEVLLKFKEYLLLKPPMRSN